jgi:CheY-like chemotaxis protein
MVTRNGTVENWRDTERLVLGDDGTVRTRVLVIDDDADLCEMMAQLLLLRGEGFETEVATNGQDALDKAHTHPSRVVLLDMNRTGISGERIM